MLNSNGTEEPKVKYNWIHKIDVSIVAGIVLLAILIWGIYAYRHRTQVATNNPPQSSQTTGDNNVIAPTTTPAETGIPTKKLSYGEAIKAYPYRFQFSNCSGNPGSMSVKTGSLVMLDNRDAVAHTIKANGQTFKIAKYDYALLRTSAITDRFITCDGGGSATLNVEK